MTLTDLNNAYLLGQWKQASFSKLPSQTTLQGLWFDLSLSPGNPTAQYYFATPLAATALARSTDGGLDHGSDRTGYQKYLHKFLFQTVSASAVPLAIEILDYLMYYPGVATDVGLQTLTTSISLPRQVTGKEGAGVQIMMVEQNPYATGLVSFSLTYTNQSGEAGRITPTATINQNFATGNIATSGQTAAGQTGRFVPLQAGDSGVRSIQSIEFTGSDVGLVALVLVKPLARASVFAIDAPAEIDFLQMFGYLPRISADAYLNLIVKVPASIASVPLTGELTTVWSNT